MSYKLFVGYVAILDEFPYHVWVGEHQRSVVGDTAEKVHTVAKMILHENYKGYASGGNDIGMVQFLASTNFSFYTA